MTTPLTTRDRIKLGCIKLKTTQTKLAVNIGTSKQEIAHVGSGRYRTGRIVDGIAKELKTTAAWLIDGAGDPPSWLDANAETPKALTVEDRLAEANTIIRALTQQVRALELENRQQAERIEALEGDRPTTPPQVGAR